MSLALNRDELIALLAEHGTQEAVAEATGLSQGYISKLVRRFNIPRNRAEVSKENAANAVLSGAVSGMVSAGVAEVGG